MTQFVETAQRVLRSRGLHAEVSTDASLHVWAREEHTPEGIILTRDLSWLYVPDDGRLVMQFPGPGQCRYEIRGEADDVLALIGDVYRLYLETGVSLAAAVEELVPEADREIIGRPRGLETANRP